MLQQNNFNHLHLRLFITIGVMILAGMRSVDMTITNVALPHMMVSLGANGDQITWVVTSYITATAVITPLIGFLATRYGRKRLILISSSGFIVASLLCGISTNLTFILIARTLQGGFGAALNPLAQSIMLDNYPREQSRIAMGIYSMGVMVAPVFGPLLGAYITETMSWHWLFLLNVPICAIAFVLCYFFLKETKTQIIPIGWTDIILIIVSIGSLQLVLDRGDQEDWFESGFIFLLTVTSLIASVSYLLRQLFNPTKQVINFTVFKDRNFTLCFILTIIFFAGALSKLTVLPIMLTNLFNYPIIENGKLFAPLGIASLVGALLCTKLMKYYSGKWLSFLGAVLSIISSVYMLSFNLTATWDAFVVPNIIQGLGIGLFFTPISTIAFYTLSQSLIDQASALLNFARNVGSAIGIAIISNIITRKEQINWQHLIAHINPYNKNFVEQLEHWQFHYQNLTQSKLLAHTIFLQASMKAYVEAFYFTAVLFFIMLPLIFVIKNNPLDK